MRMEAIIKERIVREGPLSFADFMDMALYHPEGYYNQEQDPIGTTGDFYTIPHLTPLVGAMITRQLCEMWEILGNPDPFAVVEFGAGNGNLCRAILRNAAEFPDFRDCLRYQIVERSAPSSSISKICRHERRNEGANQEHGTRVAPRG